MNNNNSYLPYVKGYILTILFLGTFCSISAQRGTSSGLFKSSDFTTDNSFTSGVEGPAVDRNGVVYAVNFLRDGTIGNIEPDGRASVFINLPKGSIGNGIRFNSHGDMFIADYTSHSILKVDMITRQLKVFAHEPLMSQPNDIAIDGKDRLYASDPDWKAETGNIWRIDLNGKVTLLEKNMGTANGIEVSPNEKTLYVNESIQRKVWAYHLSPDGNVTNKRLLVQFPDFQLDGMRCDIKGNLYITRPGKGTVVEVSPEGKIIREISLMGETPSNLAFGGKDGRIIYVTIQDKGNIEMFHVDFPGRAWKMMKRYKKHVFVNKK